MNPNPNPNVITARPDPGQCWVCHRRDTVPTDQRGLIPEVCSDRCREGWSLQYEITPDLATHVVDGDEWVPAPPLGAAVAAGYARLEEIEAATQPVVPRSKVIPVGEPFPGFPRVDAVVAEAGPPVTPVTGAELATLRAQQPPARPVPGSWLRTFFAGVFR